MANRDHAYYEAWNEYAEKVKPSRDAMRKRLEELNLAEEAETLQDLLDWPILLACCLHDNMNAQKWSIPEALEDEQEVKQKVVQLKLCSSPSRSSRCAGAWHSRCLKPAWTAARSWPASRRSARPSP